MTEYPTPEYVADLAAARAYLMELGLDAQEVVDVRKISLVGGGPPQYRITLSDGQVIEHDGPHALSRGQVRAITTVAQQVKQIWEQLHDSPAVRPKSWKSTRTIEHEEQP